MLITAIFGLVGVVIGGVITGAVELWLEKRREGAAVHTARLLVADELQTSWMHLDAMVEAGDAPDPLSDERRARFLPTTMWHAHKVTLAAKGALQTPSWTTLAVGQHSIESVRIVVLELTPQTAIQPMLLDRIRS